MSSRNIISIGETKISLTKVKRQAAKHQGDATHYLCHVPAQPLEESPFTASYREVTGRKEFPAYWGVFDSKTRGFSLADEKYPLPNTDDGMYPKSILA